MTFTVPVVGQAILLYMILYLTTITEICMSVTG